MRILVSAFACSPLWGSEPSVGWNWARELAQYHDVTVLTHNYFRQHIDAHLKSIPEPRLRCEYLALETGHGAFHEQLLNSQRYYMRWQRHARKRLLQLIAHERFDLLHHVTWGNFRWPLPLYGLSVPVAVGPLGGGERAPASLYRGLPWRLRIKESLRNFLIWTGTHDPWVKRGLSEASWVLCRTQDTIQALPTKARGKAFIAHDIGSPPPLSEIGALDAASPQGQLRCLFVGRLLAWKGAHFALQALQLANANGISITLTLVGSGELEVHLRLLAQQLRIEQLITWRQSLPRVEVLQLYREHDLFLFPSLHDSGGTVVLESLSRGCPVVCVDLGGPPHFIDDSCGRVVVAADGNERAVPRRLAGVLQALAQDPTLRAQLRRGALRKAQAHAWPARVKAAYQPIEQALGQSS